MDCIAPFSKKKRKQTCFFLWLPVPHKFHLLSWEAGASPWGVTHWYPSSSQGLTSPPTAMHCWERGWRASTRAIILPWSVSWEEVLSSVLVCLQLHALPLVSEDSDLHSPFDRWLERPGCPVLRISVASLPKPHSPNGFICELPFALHLLTPEFLSTASELKSGRKKAYVDT